MSQQWSHLNWATCVQTRLNYRMPRTSELCPHSHSVFWTVSNCKWLLRLSTDQECLGLRLQFAFQDNCVSGVKLTRGGVNESGIYIQMKNWVKQNEQYSTLPPLPCGLCNSLKHQNQAMSKKWNRKSIMITKVARFKWIILQCETRNVFFSPKVT